MPPSWKTLLPIVLVLLAVVVALVAAGCNVVRIRQRHLEGRFRAAGMETGTFDTPVGRVRARFGGTGPPVVLIHGFGAEAIWQWYPQVRALLRDHRVVVPDLLWFGGSEGTPGSFSLGDQTRAVAAVLDHLHIPRADVVGMSYGGMVAWALALEHPDRLGRLVLVDTPGPVYRPEDFERFLARFGVSRPGELFVPAEAERVQGLIDLAFWRPPHMPGWVGRQVVRDLYGQWRAEKVALLDALRDHLRDPPSMIAPEIPVLLIWGRHDEVFPVDVAERLQAALGPRASLRVIERARHAPNLEHPREFNRLLLDFLR